jgi:inhibitor of KinA
MTKICPLGEQAVVVEFGNVISDDLNRKAIGLAEHFDANPFPGYIESVPAYASTTVFYDPLTVRRHFRQFRTAIDAVADLIRGVTDSIAHNSTDERPIIEIPAVFDEINGPDLSLVSESSGLSVDAVIELFTSTVYRVYMIGFLPGFAYMGEVDERIAMPRKQQPRQAVPKGSVGIGGRQTGIYPVESPGGWQLIGRTETEPFTPNAESPTLFQPGDRVKFVAI